LAYPTSSRVAATRLEAHAEWHAHAHHFRSSTDAAPASVRDALLRPPVVDAFVVEVRGAMDRSAAKSRLGHSTAKAATETNLGRLLGQHANLVRGARLNAQGSSAPQLSRALGKLGLDLPLSTAQVVVHYYADLAAAEGGPLLPHAVDTQAPAAGRSSSGSSSPSPWRGGAGERLMPLGRLVAEVNHWRPGALAQYGAPPPTDGALAAAHQLGLDVPTLANSGSSVFRAPVRLAPRREVETVRALLRAKAAAVAFANGGTASSLLRACLLDCVDLAISARHASCRCCCGPRLPLACRRRGAAAAPRGGPALGHQRQAVPQVPRGHARPVRSTGGVLRRGPRRRDAAPPDEPRHGGLAAGGPCGVFGGRRRSRDRRGPRQPPEPRR
jgi:hypothetical protein